MIQQQEKTQLKEHQRPINFTNQIIIEKIENKRTSLSHIIYLPIYIGMKLKNLKELEISDLNAEIGMTMQIVVRIQGIPSNLAEYLKDHMVMQIRRNDALLLKNNDQSVQVTLKEKEIKILIRSYFRVRIEPYIFFTPFEVLDLVASFFFKRILIQYQISNKKEKTILVCPNLMKKEVSQDKIEEFVNFTPDFTFANYDLAERRVSYEFNHFQSPRTLIQLQKNMYNCSFLDLQKPKKFPHTEAIQENSLPHVGFAHIHMPIYRLPYSVFTTIFIPLWILSVLNLSIFYSPGAPEKQMGQRIDNVANLLLAYFALLPTIRQNIPQTTRITLLEIIMFMVSLTPFLVILGTLDERNQSKTDFDVYHRATYTATLIITLIVLLLPLIGIILYCGYFYKKNNRDVPKKYNPKNDFQNFYQDEIIEQLFWNYKEKNRSTFLCQKVHQDKEAFQQCLKQLQIIQIKEDPDQ